MSDSQVVDLGAGFAGLETAFHPHRGLREKVELTVASERDEAAGVPDVDVRVRVRGQPKENTWNAVRYTVVYRPLFEQPMTNPERKRKQRSTLSLLLVLLALGLRILYVPAHLALEEHVVAGGHASSHATAGAENAGEDHDHDDDHPPHAALDHASELIVPRAPSQHGSIDLLALPLMEAWPFQAPRALSPTREPEPRPPRQRPRITQRPRGPPAAA